MNLESMKKLHRAFTALVSLLLLLVTFQASAKELVIGVENIEYYPLYAEREGQYSGFARDLFDEFAKQHKHTIIYRALPIERLYAEFLNGKVDLKFPDNANWASDKKVGREIHYSSGLINYIDGVIVLPKNLGRGKEALKQLGTVRGFTPWDYLGDVESGTVKIRENSQLKGLVNLAKVGRIDGIYFNVLVARYFLKHTLFEEKLLVFDPDLPHSRSAYHLSSIKHPDVVEQMSAFMKKNSDLVQALKDKYEINL